VIAPTNFLPMVRHGVGKTLPFDTEWLADSIAQSASREGYSLWWSSQVASSIVYYFQKETHPPILSLADIDGIVRLVLERIGAQNVARNFVLLPPRAAISLSSLAMEAEEGYELAFFDMLHGRLRNVASQTLSTLHIHGLRPCVKYLCQKKSWRRSCADLEAEILDHIYGCVSATQQASFRLLVT